MKCLYKNIYAPLLFWTPNKQTVFQTLLPLSLERLILSTTKPQYPHFITTNACILKENDILIATDLTFGVTYLREFDIYMYIYINFNKWAKLAQKCIEIVKNSPNWHLRNIGEGTYYIMIYWTWEFVKNVPTQNISKMSMLFDQNHSFFFLKKTTSGWKIVINPAFYGDPELLDR